MRFLLAAVFTLAGAAAAVFAMIRPWQDGRTASEFGLAGLFGDADAGSSGFFTSIAFLLALAIAAGVIGLLTRLRLILAVALVLCFLPTALWALERADGFTIAGAESGLTNAAAACGAFLVAMLMLPRR
ncbi:hypothetical protein [Amycolatopsis palatopharyngis]|uniref:hypothetical protein n=1 Tax=Amycolatopsis palatopharyngis TaxID=187982 RepID=UPI000E245130|nr:hypothetical protein [Amycolatopsis palatopharyngis]